MATHQLQPTNSTETLAAYAANIAYESLPSGAVIALKQVVLDSLGTAVAATTLGAGCRELVEVIRGMGGTAESTIIGFGDQVPAAHAAFVNGGLAHALNYDAVGAGHPGVLVPAPLAVAEKVGNVSGKDFLAALAAGMEITARINMALTLAGVNASQTFLEGQLVSIFGATASAGRLLKLSPTEMRSAIGLALMQASGTMQVVVGGDPPAKAIYAAFPNYGGVMAALLAKQGLDAECDALEGEAGFFAMYYGGNYVREALEQGLGTEFRCTDVRFKPWPTSGIPHPFIQAAATLAERHSLTPDVIERVHITAEPRARHWMEPIAERRRPQNAASAANSIPFATAKALVNGRVTLADITSAGLQEPEALAVAERLEYSYDEGLKGGAIVEVATADGRLLTERVDSPLGSAANPMSYEQLVTKFRDCVTYAVQPIPESAVQQFLDLVAHLEELPDVSALPTTLVAGRG
jgi:2-methylcitrate dehydratase PrpD